MKDNPYELLYMIRMGSEPAMRRMMEIYGEIIEIEAKTCVHHMNNYQLYYDDLMEEGCSALMHAIWSYRDDRGASFHTYAVLVIRRHMWNTLRKYQTDNYCGPHHLVYYQALDENGIDMESRLVCRDSSADPAYCCRYEEAKERVKEAVKELTDSEREIYESLLNGETRKSIIERLGCSEKSYDGRLRRVRGKMRRAVYGEEYSDA